MIVLAGFVLPVSGGVAYALQGTGGLIADVIACMVILSAIWWRLRRANVRR